MNKKLFLLIAVLAGVLNTDCYTYRVINRTPGNITANLDVFNWDITSSCRDSKLEIGTIAAGKQVDKTWGGRNSGCTMAGFNAASDYHNYKSSSIDITVGPFGRAGNLTFLVFSKGNEGPFIQWDEGIRDAWDPTDKNKRRPYPGDKPELPVVEIKE